MISFRILAPRKVSRYRTREKSSMCSICVDVWSIFLVGVSPCFISFNYFSRHFYLYRRVRYLLWIVFIHRIIAKFEKGGYGQKGKCYDRKTLCKNPVFFCTQDCSEKKAVQKAAFTNCKSESRICSLTFCFLFICLSLYPSVFMLIFLSSCLFGYLFACLFYCLVPLLFWSFYPTIYLLLFLTRSFISSSSSLPSSISSSTTSSSSSILLNYILLLLYVFRIRPPPPLLSSASSDKTSSSSFLLLFF